MRQVMVSIFAFTLSACSSEKAPTETTDKTPAAVDESGAIRLYAFDCGHIDMLDLSIFDRNGAYDGRQNTAVDMCFLIRHPKGDLLWDTGLPDALNNEPDGVASAAFRVSMPRTVKGQLAELGLTPGEIDYLALSHSHFDHAGNAGEFAAATWIVDEKERAHMFTAEARANEATFPAYSALESAATIMYTDDYDVFDDSTVVIIRTPGHTPGHASLLVRLEKTGPILLSGDLYHLAEARERRTVPMFNSDAEETLRSMKKFEALAASESARVIIQHEDNDYLALPAPPAYLD